MTRAARERLRLRFRPERVRVLFVGESPPVAGTFFFAADSELYRATRDAFEAALPRFRNVDPFLKAFAESGCYLVDLSLDPINQLTDRADGSWDYGDVPEPLASPPACVPKRISGIASPARSAKSALEKQRGAAMPLLFKL